MPNQATWNLLIYAVSALGFPICVTCFLLYERLTVMRELVRELDTLQVALARLSTLIEERVSLVRPPLDRRVK